MKGIIILITVAAVLAEAKNYNRASFTRNQSHRNAPVSSSSSSSEESIDFHAFTHDENWHNYKLVHQKQYKTHHEEIARYRNYKLNDVLIREHNKLYQKGLKTYKMRHTQFSDMTDFEIMSMRPRIIEDHSTFSNSSIIPSPHDVPESLSYQSSCLSVVNQNPCGSCWAFAATAQVETQLRRKDSSFNTHISPQYLLDCAENGGCQLGGWSFEGLKYLYRHGLVATENYKYLARQTPCRANVERMPEKIVSPPVAIFVNGDEEKLKEILATQGPVVISYFATKNFSFVGDGVFLEPNCPNKCEGTNHAMLLIGYGRDDDKDLDYWLIKNSYGRYWGEEGYFRAIRNTGELNNNCNVACYARYAQV